MKSLLYVLTIIVLVTLAACAPSSTSIPEAATISEPTLTVITPQEGATALPIPPTEPRVVVAFVTDGNIRLWDEATHQTQTIYASGDVRAVSMSEDGQFIAFTRHSWVGEAMEGYEQGALWAVDRDGRNPRELVSAESLRQYLNAGQRDSTNFPQMEWVPGSHRMLFSGWKYLVQAEGESHAVPEGLFLVDAETLTENVLVPAGNHLRFMPSPDGRQIALMSLTGLSFINVEGSDLRQDVLTYPQVGQSVPLFPTGVWAQDSSAFVLTGSFESDPSFNLNFTIWRVPVDGSTPQALAAVAKSHPGSVTFSPDGQRAAFLQSTEEQSSQIAGWSITLLNGTVSPLAIPSDLETGYASVHWSPAGDLFTGNLRKLCPDAARDTDECDTRIHFWGNVATIHWIDGNRLLFLTRDPSVLFLGKMEFVESWDGTTIPIVAWPVEDSVGPKQFTAALAR